MFHLPENTCSFMFYVGNMLLNGHQFGVLVDRNTAWPGVFAGETGADVTKFLARLCE
jgi:hypothetical protein